MAPFPYRHLDSETVALKPENTLPSTVFSSQQHVKNKRKGLFTHTFSFLLCFFGLNEHKPNDCLHVSETR